MNNNEFMNLLAVASKNHNKNNQLIILGALAGLAITGCCLLYFRNKKANNRYNELQREHCNEKVQTLITKAQIRQLNNSISQLKAEKEIKSDNNPDNNTSATQETPTA